MNLTIVIPAYDEEAAIAATIENCSKAKVELLRALPLAGIDIVVVDDGSTDRTAEIARRYSDEVRLIQHPKNRGYGAALKTGFASSNSELLAFLDGDGTCDAMTFVELVRHLLDKDADICIGSRLHSESRMPPVRRFGNRLFSALINIIGNTKITDSASGMRVFRRSILPHIAPLPDQLHFTPAMSCRAVLDESLKIVEVPIPYEERIGESKLSTLRDGARFAIVILDIALTYRPLRLFALPATLFLLLGLGFGSATLFTYLKTGQISPGLIYRILAILVFSAAGLTLVTVGVLSEQAAHLLHPRAKRFSWASKLLRQMASQTTLFVFSLLSLAVGAAFSINPVRDYVSFGGIHSHWSQVALAGFLGLIGIQTLALGILGRMLSHLHLKQRARDAEKME